MRVCIGKRKRLNFFLWKGQRRLKIHFLLEKDFFRRKISKSLFFLNNMIPHLLCWLRNSLLKKWFISFPLHETADQKMKKNTGDEGEDEDEDEDEDEGEKEIKFTQMK